MYTVIFTVMTVSHLYVVIIPSLLTLISPVHPVICPMLIRASRVTHGVKMAPASLIALHIIMGCIVGISVYLACLYVYVGWQELMDCRILGCWHNWWWLKYL